MDLEHSDLAASRICWKPREANLNKAVKMSIIRDIRSIGRMNIMSDCHGAIMESLGSNLQMPVGAIPDKWNIYSKFPAVVVDMVVLHVVVPWGGRRILLYGQNLSSACRHNCHNSIHPNVAPRMVLKAQIVCYL